MNGHDKCRSCGASIFFVQTARGKTMPMDAEPCEDGNMVLIEGVAFSTAKVKDAMLMPRYKSHYATCADAKRWRKS